MSTSFCAECNNLLYPRENKQEKRLMYSCRNCDYTVYADSNRVFRNELMTKVGQTAGVTQDIGKDPTLPRTRKTCPKCQNREAVFFQSQARRAETKMTLFYVCVACGHIYEDIGTE